MTPSSSLDALVRVQSDDEALYDALLSTIEQRTTRLAELEEEVAPLHRALEKFEWQYNSQLGGLQRDLRNLRRQVETIEQRTARIHARMVADPNHVMGDLFNDEELREIGELFEVELPESWFSGPREAQARQREERSDDEQYDAEEELERQIRMRAEKPRLNEHDEQEIRTLHRALARRFHPDLADTEAERAVCQEMMLRINAAWHSRDLDALRTLDEQSGDLAGLTARDGYGRRIHWARQECVRLDERIRDVNERLTSLRESTTFPLWFNQTLAQTVITQRASVLRVDIATEQERLADIKLAFRQALAAYAAVVA